MRSLFVRFFLSFWLIIGITIGTAAIGGFWYSERMREAIESFELGDSMLEASQALESDGRDGLLQWLTDFPRSAGVSIFILDERGRDILQRRPPYGVMRIFRRHREHFREHRHDSDEPRNLRRARPLPQLIAANALGDRASQGFKQYSMGDPVPAADVRWRPYAAELLQPGVLGTHRGVVEPGTDRVGQLDLSVIIGQQPGLGPLQHAEFPTLETGRVFLR